MLKSMREENEQHFRENVTFHALGANLHPLERIAR
jgi:hypothetical protein